MFKLLLFSIIFTALYLGYLHLKGDNISSLMEEKTTKIIKSIYNLQSNYASKLKEKVLKERTTLKDETEIINLINTKSAKEKKKNFQSKLK